VVVVRQVTTVLHRQQADAVQTATVRDHQVAARPQHPGELGQHRRQIGHVHQRQAAHHDVHVIVGQRQVPQVGHVKVRVGQLFAGPRQHLRRRVDADHPMAQRGQVGRMPSGSTRGVQRDPDRQTVQDGPDHRLLQVDQLIAGPIVVVRPAPVSLHTGDRLGRTAAADLCVQQIADLGQPRLGERPVVLAGEGAQQRDAFEP
jgi:hypothetical protein